MNPAAHARAHPIPGRDTDAISALAKEHGIWICCGLAEMAGEEVRAVKTPFGRIGLLIWRISNGPWRGYVYGGQSVAADGKGSVLVKCRDRDREVKVIEVRLPR